MPTQHPRIYLTMKAETLAIVDRLGEKLKMSRPQVLRKALRELAKKELP